MPVRLDLDVTSMYGRTIEGNGCGTGINHGAEVLYTGRSSKSCSTDGRPGWSPFRYAREFACGAVEYAMVFLSAFLQTPKTIILVSGQ